jgi:phosphohistidine swiveling domain-containing protein
MSGRGRASRGIVTNVETVVWSRRIADELWSGVVTPLTYTMLADRMAEHLARRRLVRAGLGKASTRPVFRLVRGHVYVNASLVAEVMKEIPHSFVSEGLLELLPAILRDEVRSSRRPVLSAQTIGTVLQLTRSERAWMPWSRGELFRREAASVLAELPNLALRPGDGPQAILAGMSRVQARLAGYLEVVSWGMIYAFVFFHLTAQLLERWAPEERASMAQLTSGLPGIRTFEVHDELLACAALSREDGALRRDVLGSTAAETIARARSGRLGLFGDALLGVLARHGHRLTGRDLSFPTWRERPEVVVEMIQKLMRGGPLPTARERSDRREELLGRVLRRISTGLGGTLRREIFLRGLSWCQEYYAVRENMRYHADGFLAALRAFALSAADRLGAVGALSRREDVFYLTEPELRSALATLSPDGAVPDSLARDAAARWSEYLEFRTSPPPEVLVGDARVAAAEVPARRRGAEGVSLRGLGVSPGRVEGSARVVRSVEELQALRAGEVIVAATTDPSWTSLLALGGALVLEVGGLLSHGAIVARELGIPAVVDVAAATSLVATGDVLAVDGSAGTVDLRS